MPAVSHMQRVLGVLHLTGVFFIELWLSSVAVAKAALSPRPHTASAIIAVPLDLRTDIGIAMLANLVTLTPGTCSLHVSDDRRTLYVHALDAADPDQVIRSIKQTFERAIARIEG